MINPKSSHYLPSAAAMLTSLESFGFSYVHSKTAKYTTDLISKPLLDLADKITLTFALVIKSIRESIHQAIESFMLRLTTTQILPPTLVDQETFCGPLQNGIRPLDQARKRLPEAKAQIKKDLERPLNTRFRCNGQELGSTGLQLIESEVSRTTPSEIKQIQIYNMFHQGLFGTAFSLTLPENPTEEQCKTFSLQQGADYFFSSQGKNFLFKTSSETIYDLNTEQQTITGHLLITPLTDKFIQGCLNAVGQPGIPDRPFYIRTTYNYARNTIEIQQLASKYFPAHTQTTSKVDIGRRQSLGVKRL